jgi:fatty-acyl-CoA synthase
MTAISHTATPNDLAELPASTYALLHAAAGRFGNAPALTYIRDAAALHDAHTLSFRELLVKVTQAANLFHSVGIGAGDVVAYALPNLPETHFALWGAEAAGIAMAINPALPAEQAAELLRTAGARVLVTTASAAPGDFLASIAPHLASCPSLTHVFVVGHATLPALPGQSVMDFRAEMNLQRGDALASGRLIRPHDPSSWFCTGGTTGVPKIAKRTHGNEVANARMIEIALAGHAGPGRNFFCGLPLFHVNAAMVTGLVPWLAGSHVVCGPANGYRDRAVIANFWALVEAYRINVFSGVPTIYGTLLQQPVSGHDLSSLDFAICGAAPMPVELFKRFEAATGIRILEGYGLTESACVASFNPIDGERRIGSIGQALPWQQMKCVILDESGCYLREAATDEVGVIALAGPNIFEGYNSKEHNATAWIDCHDEKRWFNTGDLGRREAEGYFWLTGRKKDLIIRGGHNIDPAAIEKPLLRHPDIALAAAVGRPDAHAGEVPVVYVQLRDGASVDEDELLAFAVRSIGERAAVPKAVRVVAQIPVTAVGKIFKPALIKREIEDVVRFEAARCGIVLEALDVTMDAKRGMVASVRARGSELALRSALGHYAFATEFTEA